MSLTRRRLLGDALAVAAASQTLDLSAAGAAVRPVRTDPKRYAREARQVRDVYREAWAAYKKYAFGADELRPVSGTSKPFYLPRESVGLTVVEALDTLYLMGLDRQVGVARRWLRNEFDPAIRGEISLFETTIRLVGGLLAAYHVTRDRTLLARAAELGDRLLPAFERSPTGIPYQRVDPSTGAVSGAVLSVGECNHLVEFAELSRLTGRPKYFAAAKRAAGAVLLRRSSLDLLPLSIHVETGSANQPAATIDPPADSFVESLWDGWLLTRDRDLRAWFDVVQAGLLRRLFVRRPSGRWWFRHAHFRTGAETSSRANELSAYYAGLLAESGQRLEARRYLASWTALLERHPLLPVSVDTVTGAVLDPRNELYPEYVDSCLTGWLASGDERYRRLAARYWRRELEHLRVPGRGMTIATDATVRPVKTGDLTPGYWFSESPKYCWLMFSGTERFDYRRRRHLLTTEGKILRGARGPRGG